MQSLMIPMERYNKTCDNTYLNTICVRVCARACVCARLCVCVCACVCAGMEKSFHSLPVSNSFVKSEAGTTVFIFAGRWRGSAEGGWDQEHDRRRPYFHNWEGPGRWISASPGSFHADSWTSCCCVESQPASLEGPRNGEEASMARRGWDHRSQRGGDRGGRFETLADCRSAMGAAVEDRLTAAMMRKVLGTW